MVRCIMCKILFSLLSCIVLVNNVVSLEQSENSDQLPFFFGNSSAGQITVDVGSDMKIECYAGGWPTPDVYITRDNDIPLRENRTIFQGNVLEIKNITKKEEGRYRCYANNTAAGFPKFTMVEVLSPPIIRSCALTVNYHPEPNVALECSIESHVTPDIVWFENNQQYDSSDSGPNFESMVTSNGRLFTASLKIYSLKTEMTYYSIWTNNSLGINEAIVGRFPNVPVQFPSIPRCPIVNSPQSDCPTSSCFVYIIFMVIFLIIIAIFVGVGVMNRRVVQEFRIFTKVPYRMPANDF